MRGKMSYSVSSCSAVLSRIKKRHIYVISTMKRPVPLEHYLYTGNSTKTQKEMFLLVDSVGNFQTKGYELSGLTASLRGHLKLVLTREVCVSSQVLWRCRCQERAHQQTQPVIRHQEHFLPDHIREPGSPLHIASLWPPSSVSFLPGFLTRLLFAASASQDRNVWLTLLHFLSQRQQTPVVAFTFSRARCDENARSLDSLDLTSSVEKAEIHSFFQKSLGRLRGGDRQLPQAG